MKSFLSILFSLLFLLGGILCNDIEELAKVPSLINHYYEHEAKENDDFDFVDFLVMHYASDHEHSSDNPDLPFYHHNCPNLTIIQMPVFQVNLVPPVLNTIHHGIYTFVFPEETAHTFLKPPKA